MAIEQSGRGRIEVFMDFLGAELPLAGTVNPGAGITAALLNFHPLVVRGEGVEDPDCGIVPVSDALSGVVRFTSANETTGDAIILGTETCLRVDKMAPIIIEARVKLPLKTEREIFIGLCGNFHIDQDEILIGTTETLALTENDLCGFFYGSNLSESLSWYMVYNGGTTTGETDASEVISDNMPVQDKFDILRLEVDNNGTARWFINGVLEQTVKGAISTSVVMSAQIAVVYTASAVATLDVDYFYISANRDWTI